MSLDGIVYELAVILVGAFVLGTLFLYARQPIVTAYIAVGFITGPSCLALIPQTEHIEKISHVGVILLLFLIGLGLRPDKVVKVFQRTALLTGGTALAFGALSTTFALALGFALHAALIFGAALMFSSTVVGLKLIPTTSLHHRRVGELMTGVLLVQDVLAILVILLISGEQSSNVAVTFAVLALKTFGLALAAFAGVRFLMLPLLARFDVVQEYTFVATLGWCLLGAEAAHLLGVSYEIGAFIAGVSIASSPVALAIAEHLKPLREFFLILFFFAVGAGLDLTLAPGLLLPAAAFGIALVLIKAAVFRFGFKRIGESTGLARELSVRLSQASEFSLLVAFTAASVGALTAEQAMAVQVTTIITFVLSTYWVVLRYPTPIATSANLRQD